MKIRELLRRLESRIGQSYLSYILAICIGLISAAAAIGLKSSVHAVDSLSRIIQRVSGLPWILALLPILGISLTLLWVRYVIKEDIGHGVSRVLESLANPKAKPKARMMVASLVGCTLTAGFGGSVGMEGPIFSSGAAIGENMAALYKDDYRLRVLFLGCGAAGAVSAIFKAPIAGMMFCLEILALDVSAAYIIPLLISSSTACLFSILFSGYQVEFHFALSSAFEPKHLPLFGLLGILSAFLSIYFMRCLRIVEGAMKRLRHPALRVLLGGFLLGILILFFPPLFGEGYQAMHSMLVNKPGDLFQGLSFAPLVTRDLGLTLFLLLLVFLKPLATALTTGSGGVGGVFAPTLFSGCVSGYAFAKLVNLSGLAALPEMNFALAGMAGSLSGTMHAPLTAVFLIAELTGGYQLLLPLILVSSVSFVLTKGFEPYSLYSRSPGRSGHLITHDRDKAALTLLNFSDFIEPAPPALRPSMPVSELSGLASCSCRQLFPVEDARGAFLGCVSVQDLRPLLVSQELNAVLIVADILRMPEARIDAGASMAEAMEILRKTSDEELPVMAAGRMVGVALSSRIYDAYRRKLLELSGA